MTAEIASNTNSVVNQKSLSFYNRLLLAVAGLGGLLYGAVVGVIAGALPYLQATSDLNAGQLSYVVAAPMLGAVLSTLFAGLLADWMGRKSLMTVSGLLFVISIPMIALSHGYGPLVLGQLLQGLSVGLIGVAVPLYLAECLLASGRGKGAGMFQWMLTAGIAVAALIGLLFSFRLEHVAQLADPAAIFHFKDSAWRGIFWAALPGGILFLIGSLMVAESPRWLLRRGKKDAAYAALLRSRDAEQANREIREMEEVLASEKKNTSAAGGAKESLLRRKYVIPFVLACIVLAFTQATGINSIIAYNTNILLQSGLSDLAAHVGYVLFTFVNFFVTLVAVVLVDRKGRKFLLGIGTAGIIVSVICAGLLFVRTEKQRVDTRGAVQGMVGADQKLTLIYNDELAGRLLKETGGSSDAASGRTTSLVVIYSYGDFRAASQAVRSDDPASKPIQITRAGCVPVNKVVAFFSNPFGDLDASREAPLRIENALITPLPGTGNGWLVALTLFLFIASFAIGPGVCVWLALSELMPTRIRSNGMSIALVLNQGVSTGIAAIFLPTVGKYGYSTMFFGFAACTVIFFITAVWFLPETKGKTLEEIEAHFEGKGAN
ncbi:General substrate transporter [Candidatus Sulfotelmatobacter kueseliae]|uniref:General substrate transporter n=1 Tax=Candidatus Sulfotelmatobacter kueseliae TaxID=2042962 RepID=A0A2U3KMT5_9BACT|nr:General substrate transporter [Candidatus Sulfotelmatobacter kueseliae]